MKYSDVLSHFGTQIAIAKALGIKQPSVHKWAERGVPLQAQWRLWQLSGGELKPNSEMLKRFFDTKPELTFALNENAIVVCVDKV